MIDQEKFTHKVIISTKKNEHVRYFFCKDKEEANRFRIALDWVFNKHQSMNYKFNIIDISEEKKAKEEAKTIALSKKLNIVNKPKSKVKLLNKSLLEKLNENLESFTLRMMAIEEMKGIKHINEVAKVDKDLEDMQDKMSSREIATAIIKGKFI